MSENDAQLNGQSDGEASEPDLSDEHLGLAGRTARFFIHSPLSPLFYLAMMLLGLMGLIFTPRQEDPQISVPMVDVFVQYPGAAAEQVSSLAVEPLERIMSEIPGVKHVYSAAERGRGIVTVEFDVGQPMGPSREKVLAKINNSMDKIPPGVSPPLITSKGIDDVSVVNLTLWSKDMDGNGEPDVDDGQLRMLAQQVMQRLKEVPNTGDAFVVGGRREQVVVEVYPERLSGYGISLDQVANTIRTANAEQQAGGVESGDSHFTVVTGSFLRTAEEVSRLVVGSYLGSPIYVHDVAKVTQRPEDASQLVSFYTGPAYRYRDKDYHGGEKADGFPAVTVAIAKKEGTNGVSVANAILDKVEELKGTLIPSNVEVDVSRDYGQTANDKVNELIFKLFVATGFVFFLVLFAFRAFRPALVVVLVIPVVLLFTVFAAWLTGYTIDRVSLFALIFSIGILVDDAIVVVENIYRRWLEKGETDTATAVDAVREVGNPTILATFTVIGALLPMGFVSGMMGPYMEPIPALGSAAMLISLFAAFVFTPWLAMTRWLRPSLSYLQKAEDREHKGAQKLEGLFRSVLEPLMASPWKRLAFRLVLWGSLILACSMFYTKWVTVKMLPLDNKPEFSVVIDMPEGTALPVTANVAHRVASLLRELPEVTALQVYAGTARPFDFNGMVRHYYLRSQPWQGEVQVQLKHKHDRKRSSHALAVAARALLQPIAEETQAKFAVVEMPPGPPVLQSVVAEIHGPTPEIRREVARDVTEMFAQSESLTDVDNYLRDRYDYWRFHVDTEKAVRRGVSVDTINRNLAMALGGQVLGDVKQRAVLEPTNIVIQVPLSSRSEVTTLGDLPIPSSEGQVVPLGELGRFEKVVEEDIIYHKDLRPVEYVVADVHGKLAAPVYGMMQVQDMLKDYTAPDGVQVATEWIGPPKSDAKSALEWTGEWTVTYETFRDMGAAFMAALVLIYVLVVWEFGNFRIPALIMAPIPLTLLGIIPAHGLMGAEFTATSMIGWIALAGIIVRNSILLVDFSIHEVQHGTPVKEAVIRACKTRTRPIMITALALVCGSSVILTDPIFQGMAISLASGVMVSTILTLVVIPLGCIKAADSLREVAMAGVGAIEAEMIGRVAADEDNEVKSRAPTPAKPGRRAGAWALLGKLLMLPLYLIRGILLVLIQVVKSLLRRRKAPPAVKAPSAAASPPGGATPTATAPSGAPPSIPPAATPSGALAKGAAEAEPESAQAERSEAGSKVKASAGEPATARPKAPTVRPVAPKKKPAKPATKTAAPASKKKGNGAAPVTPLTVAKKKAARRGIRLKDDALPPGTDGAD